MAITNISYAVLNADAKLVQVNFDSPSASTRSVEYGATAAYGGPGSPQTTVSQTGPTSWRARFTTDTDSDGNFHFNIHMDSEVSGDQQGFIQPTPPPDPFVPTGIDVQGVVAEMPQDSTTPVKAVVAGTGTEGKDRFFVTYEVNEGNPNDLKGVFVPWDVRLNANGEATSSYHAKKPGTIHLAVQCQDFRKEFSIKVTNS